MKIGIATIFAGKMRPPSAVRFLSRFLDVIMISPIYKEINEKELKELIHLKESLDLEYVIHALFPNKGIDPKIHGYSFEVIKESLENAYKLESEIVVLHPSRRDRPKDIEILKEAYRIAEDLGIELSIENKPEDVSFLKNEEDFEALIEKIPEVRFCIDTSHFFIWSGNSERLSNLIKRYKDRISVFHIADARVGEDLQMAPGYGEINWFEVGKAISKVKAPMILEFLYPTDVMEAVLNLRHIITITFEL